jgi:hypothetical protein
MGVGKNGAACGRLISSLRSPPWFFGVHKGAQICAPFGPLLLACARLTREKCVSPDYIKPFPQGCANLRTLFFCSNGSFEAGQRFPLIMRFHKGVQICAPFISSASRFGGPLQLLRLIPAYGTHDTAKSG